MKRCSKGIFDYIDPITDEKQDKLPRSLQIETATTEAILLRLLMGQLKIEKNSIQVSQRINYLKLPFQNAKPFTYKHISDTFGVDLLRNTEPYDKYFNMNRKNHSIHEKVLFELSSFFISQEKAPVTAFAHLYRCLEYISYSFPLVYAAKSKDYKGTFTDLKKLFSGESAGELKFFKKFIPALFSDEDSVLKFQFEVDLILSQPTTYLKRDCNAIYSGFLYEIDNSKLNIKFEEVMSFFIETRNRYFHMLVGQGQENFSAIDYDIYEYFYSINPFLLNWLSIIVLKIITYGFDSTLNGL